MPPNQSFPIAMELPPSLYSTDSKGTRRVWTVTVEPGCYTVSHGVVGGKLSVHTRNCAVKNVGKSNETSALEQAYSEAQSKWLRKRDAGYRELGSTGEPDPGGLVSIVRLPVLPMLAQKYEPKKVQFPCCVQPKLDGVRAIYFNESLWSRLGKRVEGLDHIINQLKNQKGVFDGELYSRELSFQRLVSAVKRANKDTLRVCYVIYDTVLDKPFSERLEILKGIQTHPNVSVLETYRCESELAVEEFHTNFIAQGYEGIIIRNLSGTYVRRYRSFNLQKLKRFHDAEFVIVGFSEGEGCETGAILFQCRCDAGVFTVRPRGTRDERCRMFAIGDSYIGKQLTVRFQELTDSGVPRFPVGIGVRDYE